MTNPRRRRVDRANRILTVTAVGAAVFTLVVSVLPTISFAYRSIPGHVAIETTATIVGAFAAALFVGRTRRSRTLTNLLLATALGLLAGANGAFSLLPALTSDPGGPFATWAGALGRLLGGLLLLAAAFAPDRRLGRPRRALAKAGVACAATLAVIALAAVLLGDAMPPALDPSLSPESGSRPRIVGSVPLLALQLVLLAIHAAAAAGFSQRARRDRDELLLWVAVGSVLAAFSRLNFFLFPSLYSEWVYTGDFLRLGTYAAFLVGLVREVTEYQRRLAHAAVFEERRRLARELHDGLAQELVYIRQQATALAAPGGGSRAADRIAGAAERALEESRAAITALARPGDEPLGDTLLAAATAVAARGGARVRIDTDPEVRAPAELREALVRIVREATTNAVRHGSAHHVAIELRDGDGLRLRVRDDGSGFDTAVSPRPDAFGLISMRERVEGLGGRFRVSSRPGAGAVVEVDLQ
jgi:signal transduction histidine kinase